MTEGGAMKCILSPACLIFLTSCCCLPGEGIPASRPKAPDVANQERPLVIKVAGMQRGEGGKT